MGSTLFNTTPASTYPSLLKVTDNTALTNVLKTISDGAGSDTVLQLSTKRIGLLADSAVTTQATSIVQATSTNANLALVPNGIGAIVASIPDGTATGGNARGSYAVDLQMIRSAATQVAGGSYSFVIGNGNTAIGSGVIAIGDTNYVSGGESSAAIGKQNTISNFRAFAIGASHSVSGLSGVALGRQNTVSGAYAFSMGYANQATSDYSMALGSQSTASLYGSIVNANGIFAYQGDAQVIKLLARKEAILTSASLTKLSLDGTGTTNLINFGFAPAHTVSMRVNITWSAGVNDPLTSGLIKGDCISQTDQIMIKKLGGGNLSIVGLKTVIATNSDASMSTCVMNYSVNGYGELILELQAPSFVGGGNLKIRVLANLEATQCIVAPF